MNEKLEKEEFAMAKSLEERIKVLEDIEEIKKVKKTNCYCCDEKNLEGVMGIFAKECTADYGPFGKCNTRKEVRTFFENIYKTLPFFIHMITNDMIEVKGDKANAKWYFNVPSTHQPTNQAIWILGTYDEDYVREDGKWKCSRMDCIFHYVTPYDQGWVKKKMLGK